MTYRTDLSHLTVVSVMWHREVEALKIQGGTVSPKPSRKMFIGYFLYMTKSEKWVRDNNNYDKMYI